MTDEQDTETSREVLAIYNKEKKEQRDLVTFLGPVALGLAASVVGGPELTNYVIESCQEYLGNNELHDFMHSFTQVALKDDNSRLESFLLNMGPSIAYVLAPTVAALWTPKKLYDRFLRKESNLTFQYEEEYALLSESSGHDEAADGAARKVTAITLAKSTGKDLDEILEKLDTFLEREVNGEIVKGKISYDETAQQEMHKALTMVHLLTYSERGDFKKRFKEAGGIDFVYGTVGSASTIAMLSHFIIPSVALSVGLGLTGGYFSTKKLFFKPSEYSKHLYEKFVKTLS